MNECCYLEVGHVSVTLLTACVVTQLHVPLTRQTMEKVRKLLQDGVEDVLKDTTMGKLKMISPRSNLFIFHRKVKLSMTVVWWSSTVHYG